MKLTLLRDNYNQRKQQTQINSGVSKTSQDKNNQCDINRIMKRAKKNGIFPDINRRQAFYADFSKLPDYQESLNMVIRMENEFMAVPAEIRKKFDNDPKKLIDFVTNPENEDECVALELLPKPKISTKKVETPEGNFWVTTKNDREINRVKVVEKTTSAQ